MQSIRNLLWITFGVIFMACFLLMAFQNPEPMRLKFIGWQTTPLPFSYFVFAGFSSGVLLAGLMAMFEILSLQRKLRKARRMQELLEREVDALRNQPLYDEPPLVIPPSAAIVSDQTQPEEDRSLSDLLPDAPLKIEPSSSS